MPPSLKALESMATKAAETAAELLPGKLAAASEALSSRALSPQLSKSLAESPAASEILSGVSIVENSLVSAPNLARRQQIARANEALVGHVTDVLPQAHQGKLDWILGGSTAVNALSQTSQMTLLNPSRLPLIVEGKTVNLPEAARSIYGSFTRQVGDLDAFVVNGGENRFLKSPYLSSAEVHLPEAAYAALTAVGEARTSRLVQPVLMRFSEPEVAAINYAGKTVYLTGPGQLMSNKMRQVLMSYAPADAPKLTGDFSHLLDAAASIYPEAALYKFAQQGLQRNGLIYRQNLTVPWDKSPDNSKFLDFLRRTLETQEKNGTYLKGLNIDSRDSIQALHLFAKHQNHADRLALQGFINRHADFVGKFDTAGTAERAMYLQQGGQGRASQSFLTMLESLPASSRAGGINGLNMQLKAVEMDLARNSNLPALAKKMLANR